VSGGADLSYSSVEKIVTGNPIGMGSNMTFTGTGELDNGTAFTLSLAHTNQAAYSSGNVTLDMPSLGSLIITQGVSGTGIDRIDDMMPTAWEETWGTAVGTGMRTVAGVSGAAGFEWTPSSDMLPEGLSAHIAYAPKAAGSKINDKGVGGDTAGVGSGYDIVIKYSGLMDGLSFGAGMSSIEQPEHSADSKNTTTGDRSQYAAYVTYSVGSVTLGYQETRDNMQNSGGGAASYYDNEAYGISFNVSDDLSISYGSHKSAKHVNKSSSVEVTADSLQIAY
jgi:outer membrane protein OmpU